jgi:hypothetical protein
MGELASNGSPPKSRHPMKCNDGIHRPTKQGGKGIALVTFREEWHTRRLVQENLRELHRRQRLRIVMTNGAPPKGT